MFFSLQGLKTGMYYLRTKPAANPIQFTLNKEKLKDTQTAKSEEEETKERNTAAMVCSLANKDECLMCGSWMKWLTQADTLPLIFKLPYNICIFVNNYFLLYRIL